MATWFELPKFDDNPPAWFYHEAMNMDRPIIESRFTVVLLTDMRGLAVNLLRIYGRAI
jgi:hypothetical protein